MKTKITALTATICALVFSSCNYLEKLPDGDMTVEESFSNYLLANRFLANAYFHLPNENYVPANYSTADRSPYTGGSDEMEITFGDSYTHLINDGAWNPTNVEQLGMWSEPYMGIRKVNIYLENIGRVPVSGDGSFTEETRTQRRGEAYFLRALFHFHLFRCFGPIVLSDSSISTGMSVTDHKRATVSECIQFILDDCNRAEECLSLLYSDADAGRATAAAALALKSRLLLYAASPLFNGDAEYADFTDNDGENLFPSQPDTELWADAAEAALDAITKLEDTGFYGLYEEDDDAAQNFKEIYEVPFNSEWIFWRNIGIDVHPLDRCANPVSVAGFSILSPTQEMIDAYQMSNGESPVTGYNTDGTPIINSASGYVETGFTGTASPDGYWPAGVRNMYVDREPRFYACINYAGRPWKSSTCQFWHDGADGLRVATATDYCSTGYLLRKYAHEDVQYPSNQGIYLNHCVYFRLAELYLNYAEAVNEAEGPAKAYPYIKRIRERAGLPELPTGLDQNQMRERIHHERRIELAFETHRFFDVRRWKEAESQGKPIHGMNINAGTHLQDEVYYKRTLVEPRVFEKQHYLFPVPQDEINRSERVIVQNPWW